MERSGGNPIVRDDNPLSSHRSTKKAREIHAPLEEWIERRSRRATYLIESNSTSKIKVEPAGIGP